MKKKKALFPVQAAVIAALYALLTLLLWEFSSAGLQLRLSEALCVLPAFTPAAIPGLFIGCLLGNLIGGNWMDVLFGSLATLLAALGTAALGRIGKPHLRRLLVPLPAVLCNAAILPFVLTYGYGLRPDAAGLPALGFYALTIALGEAIVCYGLGIPLQLLLEKHGNKLGLG